MAFENYFFKIKNASQNISKIFFSFGGFGNEGWESSGSFYPLAVGFIIVLKERRLGLMEQIIVFKACSYLLI
jgi:hypothetical protein